MLREIGRNMTLILSRNQLLHIEPGAFKDIYLQELNIRSAFVSPAAQKAGLKALYGLGKQGRFQISEFLDRPCSLFPFLCSLFSVYSYGEA